MYCVSCADFDVMLAGWKVQESDRLDTYCIWRDVCSALQYCPFVLYVRSSCACVLLVVVVVAVESKLPSKVNTHLQ